jgi:hypothetical protein
MLLSFLILPQQQKADFSGSYVINKSKVDFGGAPEWVLPKTLKVFQSSEKIVVITTLLDDDLKEMAPVSDTLGIDGKGFDRKGSSGSQITSSVKWINDQSLQINVQSGKRHVVETWTLEDNGKSLSENREVEQANGVKYNMKAYYDKQ